MKITKTIPIFWVILFFVLFAGFYKDPLFPLDVTGLGPSGGMSGAATSVMDTVTLVFTTNSARDVASLYYTTTQDTQYVLDFLDVVASADTVMTPAEIPAFAHGVIDTTAPDGRYSTRVAYVKGPSRKAVNILDDRFNHAYRASPLVYLPYEDMIPEGATIVSARIHVSNIQTAYLDNGDTIIAVLDDIVGDSAWYGTKGVSTSPNYAHAAWQRQVSNNGGSWSGNDSDPWVPSMSERTYWWDWGEYSDWTGNFWGYTAPMERQETAGFDIFITNCVQAAVNGATNNGIIIQGAESGTASYHDYSFWHWDEDAQSINLSPYIVIKYITKKYTTPFPENKRGAFVFTSDDAYAAANEAWIPVWAAHGGRYTINFDGGQVGDANKADWPDLLDWLNDGFEIGYSGLYNNGLTGGFYGLNVYDARTPAGYDSLLADVSPDSATNRMLAATGEDLSDNEDWLTVFALPYNEWNQYVCRAIAESGYLGFRGGLVQRKDMASGEWQWGRTSDRTFGLSLSAQDTIKFGETGTRMRDPRNMFGAPYTIPISKIVGDTTVTPTEDQVKYNFTRAIWQALGEGRGGLSTFTHDFKFAASGRKGSFIEGLEANEADWILDVCDDYAIWLCGLGDYQRWNRRWSQAIDTPDDYAQPDSFNFQSNEGVWRLPDGIDNTLIRGQRDIVTVLAADITPPVAPASSGAYGTDGSVIVAWTPSSSGDVTKYIVYRSFASGDTTLLAETINTYYTDTTAINGSPHYYSISAVDGSGNRSALSPEAVAHPKATKAIPLPAYFSVWYQNLGPTDPLPASSIGQFNAVINWAYPFKGSEAEEAFDSYLDDVRIYNGDFIGLTYIIATTVNDSWATWEAGTAQRRIWDYMVAAGGDSSGFGMDVDGITVNDETYGAKFANVMWPALADTMAKMYADGLEGLGVDGDYAGLFVDLCDTTLTDHLCPGGCQDVMDFDQDDVVYSSDSDEQAAYIQFQIDFIAALRREFAERGMQNRIIVINSNFGAKTAVSSTDSTMLALVDGVMLERFVTARPGNNKDYEAFWAPAVAVRDLLVNAQISPPMMLWDAAVGIGTDATTQYQNEAVALAMRGWAGVQDYGYHQGRGGVASLSGKLPPAGLFNTLSEGDAASEPDTLDVAYTNLRVKVILGYSGTDTIFGYYISDALDTLRLGGNFPRNPDTTPPGTPTLFSLGQPGDGNMSMQWEAAKDAATYEVWRGASEPTMALYAEGITLTQYTDYNATNDSTYYWAVKAVDDNGNKSSLSNIESGYAEDIWPPSTPQSFIASGASGYIALDWISGGEADLARVRVLRALHGNTPAQIDSVAVGTSFYNDTSASADVLYDYQLVAVDDDWNTSSPTSTQEASWTAAVSGDPTISGISGTFADGDTLFVLSGSGFGTKSPAAPAIWDDFEDGTLGNTILTGGDHWDEIGSSLGRNPTYSNVHVFNGSQSMECDFSDWQGTTGVTEYADFSNGCYFDAHVYHIISTCSPQSRSLKPWELYGNGANGESPSMSFGKVGVDPTESMGIFKYGGWAEYGQPGEYPVYLPALDPNLTSGFAHTQYWMKPSSFSATNRNYDGQAWAAYNCTVQANETAIATVYLSYGVWDHFVLGYYYAWGGDGFNPAPCDPPDGDVYTYWDDVYIDITQARVEVGNASTYGACTARAIQIPRAWSDTSITIKVNTGEFAVDDDLFLFVFDSTGDVSSGYPVTVE